MLYWQTVHGCVCVCCIDRLSMDIKSVKTEVKSEMIDRNVFDQQEPTAGGNYRQAVHLDVSV